MSTEKYRRNANVQRKGVKKTKDVYKTKDKKLKANLRKQDKRYKEAVESASATEFLLPESSGFMEAETEMEKTFRVKQDEIRDSVDVLTASKGIDLKLNDFGPYHVNFNRNGTHMLITGLKGHVASMDWRKGELRAELNLNETCNAACYLQNEQFLLLHKRNTHLFMTMKVLNYIG